MSEERDDIFSHNDGGYSTPTPPAYPVPPEDRVWTKYDEPQGAEAASPAPPIKKKKPRRTMGTGGIIALCVVCAVVASLLSVGATYLVLTRSGGTAIGNVVDNIVPSPVPVISTGEDAGAVNEAANYVYELAKQQVVGITSEIIYGYNIFGQASAASVSGSGVIITDDGYILTNYHVIEDAQQGGYQVTVMMYDESTYEAEIIGFDEDSDLALLKIEAQGLSPAQLGDSDGLAVGQTVYAVGNPLGELSYTMTSGMVSATDRTINTESDVAINMFQIDAAVNSGNSGGPVYNTGGQVIGIVTAKYADTGVEGLGFAIPISEAAHITNQILEFGYVTDKASLGIKAVTVTPSIAKYYNMIEGAYVNEITPGSAAETAGLQVGDIITALDGQEVVGASELTTIIKQYHAGDMAELTVWRGGEEMSLTAVFDERLPEEEEEEESEDPASGEMQNGQEPYQYYSGNMEDFFRQFFGFGF